jgi:hypothetical protein
VVQDGAQADLDIVNDTFGVDAKGVVDGVGGAVGMSGGAVGVVALCDRTLSGEGLYLESSFPPDKPGGGEGRRLGPRSACQTSLRRGEPPGGGKTLLQ